MKQIHIRFGGASSGADSDKGADQVKIPLNNEVEQNGIEGNEE
jgi:hypothetical protein